MKTNWNKEEKDVLEKIERGDGLIPSLGLVGLNDESDFRSFYEYCKKKNSPIAKRVESYINERYKPNYIPPVLYIFLSLLVIADLIMGFVYGFWILIPLILIEFFSAFVGAYIMMLMEQEEKRVNEDD